MSTLMPPGGMSSCSASCPKTSCSSVGSPTASVGFERPITKVVHLAGPPETSVPHLTSSCRCALMLAYLSRTSLCTLFSQDACNRHSGKSDTRLFSCHSVAVFHMPADKHTSAERALRANSVGRALPLCIIIFSNLTGP